MIEVSDISKSYGNTEVIHNISFSLKKGGVTAFLGANGAGKSTTMTILTGALSPDKGRVRIGDIDLFDNPVVSKQRIGYLPENNPLYQDMYVGEYLEYVAKMYHCKSSIKEQVEEIIEIVDLKNERKKKIHTLSQGNKQRVGLAQALIHNPDILILDEPTTGLDPNQQLKINNLIREIGKTKTILFSSHRLDDVADIATHYLILKKGTLILDEDAEKIDSIKELFLQEHNENNSR